MPIVTSEVVDEENSSQGDQQIVKKSFQKGYEVSIQEKGKEKKVTIEFDTKRARIEQRPEEVGPEILDNNDFEKELDKIYAAETPDPDQDRNFASTTLKAS